MAGMEPSLSCTGVGVQYQCKTPCYLKVRELGAVLTVLFVVARFMLRSHGDPALAVKHMPGVFSSLNDFVQSPSMTLEQVRS